MIKRHILWILLLCCYGVASAQAYRVGDLYTAPDGSQGVVFFVFPDGSGGWAVALNDIPSVYPWGEYDADVAGLDNWDTENPQALMADTAGYTNTATIRGQLPFGSFAAKMVDFDNGWYLPSAGQLRILYARMPDIDAQLMAAGGSRLLFSIYWSSTEANNTAAWGVDFYKHGYGKFVTIDKNYYYRVRAVRTFTYESSYLWSTGDTTPSITVAPSQTTDYSLSVANPLGCEVAPVPVSLPVNIPYDQVVWDTVCGPYERDGMVYTSSGVYVNRFSSEAGCDSVITLYLSVAPVPEANISQQPNAVCEGEEIVLQTTVTNVGGANSLVPGDILCTDGSVLKPSEWQASGKTAMGVVFYVDSTNFHGWAVQLTDDDEYARPWAYSGSAASNTDIPGIANADGSLNANKDYDGYANTQTIRATGDEYSYPAAWLVDFDNGWYLPAAGQLSVLYSELMSVNASLQLVGGNPLAMDGFFNYWTSTESDDTQAWTLIYNGTLSKAQKYYYYSVRAVRGF